MHLFIKKFGLLFAMFGLLLNVMWPLIANANPNKPLTLMLCTSSGMKQADLAQIEQNTSSALPSSEHGTSHCPLCLSLGTSNDFIASLPEANVHFSSVSALFVSFIDSTQFFTAPPFLTPPSHAPPA